MMQSLITPKTARAFQRKYKADRLWVTGQSKDLGIDLFEKYWLGSPNYIQTVPIPWLGWITRFRLGYHSAKLTTYCGLKGWVDYDLLRLITPDEADRLKAQITLNLLTQMENPCLEYPS